MQWWEMSQILWMRPQAQCWLYVCICPIFSPFIHSAAVQIQMLSCRGAAALHILAVCVHIYICETILIHLILCWLVLLLFQMSSMIPSWRQGQWFSEGKSHQCSVAHALRGKINTDHTEYWFSVSLLFQMTKNVFGWLGIDSLIHPHSSL